MIAGRALLPPPSRPKRPQGRNGGGGDPLEGDNNDAWEDATWADEPGICRCCVCIGASLLEFEQSSTSMTRSCGRQQLDPKHQPCSSETRLSWTCHDNRRRRRFLAGQEQVPTNVWFEGSNPSGVVNEIDVLEQQQLMLLAAAGAHTHFLKTGWCLLGILAARCCSRQLLANELLCNRQLHDSVTHPVPCSCSKHSTIDGAWRIAGVAIISVAILCWMLGDDSLDAVPSASGMRSPPVEAKRRHPAAPTALGRCAHRLQAIPCKQCRASNAVHSPAANHSPRILDRASPPRVSTEPLW